MSPSPSSRGRRRRMPVTEPTRDCATRSPWISGTRSSWMRRSVSGTVSTTGSSSTRPTRSMPGFSARTGSSSSSMRTSRRSAIRWADAIVSWAILVAAVSSRTVPLRSLRVRGSWASASVWVWRRFSNSVSPGMRGIPSPRRGSTSAPVRDRRPPRNRTCRSGRSDASGAVWWTAEPGSVELPAVRRTVAGRLPGPTPARSPTLPSPGSVRGELAGVYDPLGHLADLRVALHGDLRERLEGLVGGHLEPLHEDPFRLVDDGPGVEGGLQMAGALDGALVEVHVRNRHGGVGGEPGDQFAGARGRRGGVPGADVQGPLEPFLDRKRDGQDGVAAVLRGGSGELGPLRRAAGVGDLGRLPRRGRREAGTISQAVLREVQLERQVTTGGHGGRTPAPEDRDRRDGFTRQHPACQLRHGVEH